MVAYWNSLSYHSGRRLDIAPLSAYGYQIFWRRPELPELLTFGSVAQPWMNCDIDRSIIRILKAKLVEWDGPSHAARYRRQSLSKYNRESCSLSSLTNISR